MLRLLVDPVRAKIAKDATSILKPASEVFGQVHLALHVQGPEPPVGEDCVTNVATGDITPRTCRISQALFPDMELRVGEPRKPLADLIVWDTVQAFCVAFISFAVEIKHFSECFPMFYLLSFLSFSPFLSLTLGTSCVSILDLFWILGSMRGWFPVLVWFRFWFFFAPF